jgi:uncharacterized protein YecE (DUF72 family)
MTGTPGSLQRLAQAGIYVGITAWTEPTLVQAGYYPPEAESAEERLRYYAAEFPITEVDATYYAPPSTRVAELWAARTPDGFVFDIKAFRLLTEHPTPPKSLWKDVREALPAELQAKRNVYPKDLGSDVMDEALDRFVTALEPLRHAGKLGVLLFQFPEYVHPVKRSYAHLDWLAEHLGRSGDVGAIEFRQQKWMDDDHRETTLNFLEERGFAYVCVDEPQGFPSSIPPVAAATTGVAVVRFHGRNTETWTKRGITAAERFAYDYTQHPGELEEWVPKIRELHDGGRPVHALMNNCYADYGVNSGRALAQLLEGDAGGGDSGAGVDQ